MGKNDGGPAFPLHADNLNVGDSAFKAISGMSLRDHYAGLALQGMLANPNVLTEMGAFHESNFKAAWLFADAMLKARDA